MSFSTPDRSPTASPAPWRPGEFSIEVIKAHPGFDALPDAFPSAERPIGLHSLPAAAPPPPKASPLIRAKAKAAQWSAAIHRAWAYLTGRISDPAQQAALDATLEQTLAAGPDFAKVRSNATFAPVEIVAYDWAVAREMMSQARKIDRGGGGLRVKGRHGGVLGRPALLLYEWFCFDMWKRSDRFGMVPSLDYIADETDMARATVVAALARLELFGLMTITRRRKRIDTKFGAKVVQDTNAYVLSLANGLGALALAVAARNAADRRAGGSEYRSRAAIRNDDRYSTAKAKSRDRQPGFMPLLT